MAAIPDPPWTLGGEMVVALAWRARLRSPLPPGVQRVPGPVVVTAERWTSSPVGPYLGMAVGEPARAGGRIGLCFTTVVVSTTDSRAAGRALWGFPRECGTIGWVSDADTAEIRWEERGIVLRGAFRRFTVPVLLARPALQRRGDEPVVVPTRLRGRVRPGRVDVDVPPGDPLARLAGRRRGGHIGGVEMVLHRVVAPTGLRERLRAPARGVEPGIP